MVEDEEKSTKAFTVANSKWDAAHKSDEETETPAAAVAFSSDEETENSAAAVAVSSDGETSDPDTDSSSLPGSQSESLLQDEQSIRDKFKGKYDRLSSTGTYSPKCISLFS
jgi:hypothetical protein